MGVRCCVSPVICQMLLTPKATVTDPSPANSSVRTAGCSVAFQAGTQKKCVTIQEWTVEDGVEFFFYFFVFFVFNIFELPYNG